MSEAQGARGCVEGGGGRGEGLYLDVGAMTGLPRSLQRVGPEWGIQSESGSRASFFFDLCLDP
eukprot:COSAG01_NODE_52688_length_345_cov_0.439024_1_plen_62_part_10